MNILSKFKYRFYCIKRQRKSKIHAGYSKKFRQGCLCYFFGLKFDKFLFFGVAQNESYFLGVEK